MIRELAQHLNLKDDLKVNVVSQVELMMFVISISLSINFATKCPTSGMLEAVIRGQLSHS